MDPLSEPRPLFVHEGEHLLVLDKPAGLLSVPGRGEDKQDCLSARVQQRHPDARIVHRLDMATSGLIVMARGARVQSMLSRAFSDRRVGKRYVAVVEGLVKEDAGTIDLPLRVDWPNRPLRIVDAEAGKPSTTHWRVLSRDAQSNTTRLELEPVTGRSHQLRVHLLAAGHPILGDPLYASEAVHARAPRLLLHANSLALDEPFTGEPLRFASAPPF